MKKIKKIAVDIDDCLANLNYHLIRYHNDVYDTNLRKEDFSSCLYSDIWGGTPLEAAEKMREFYQTRYFQSITPVDDSRAALTALKKNGCELHVVTGRDSFLEKDTAAWVEKYFPNLFSGIHHTSSYTETEKDKRRKKSTVCRQIGAEIIIEDDLMHIIDCLEAGIEVIIFDNPWNRSFNTPAGAKRAHNWTEIPELVKI